MASCLNVTYVGSYPPRHCGIATFTSDLAGACGALTRTPPQVVALNNTDEGYSYPPEVRFQIQRDRLQDYREAAEYVNRSAADVLSVQHEFGLFGGLAGSHLTTLLRAVNKPVVTTLHTVLRNPAPDYEASTRALIRHSQALVVMSEVAREILVERYGAPREKISLIYHGVPDVPLGDGVEHKRRFGLEGRFVLLTFGLLSENKGIETAIEALPPVVKERPDVIYVVLGATHPEIKKREGERYRRELELRVRRLGLTEHVLFVNRFVDLDTLCRYIGASDLYITPYLSREQVVSGTLSYALAMGKAIVSTPYWYAEELLADGRGVLVPFKDPKALSEAILALVRDPARLDAIRRSAYAFGRRMVWSEVAKAYVALFERVKEHRREPVWVGNGERQQNDQATSQGRPQAKEHARAQARVQARVQAGPEEPPALRGDDLPEVNLDHLRRLTDDTGLIQHATYGVPDRRFGYSADDAGRALVALTGLASEGTAGASGRRETARQAVELVDRYLSFLQYAQTPEGHFHNFMSYDRSFKDERGSDDTLGRVVWGLGHVVKSAPKTGTAFLARDMLERALVPLESLRAPRAKAYAICGLAAALERHPEHAAYRRLLEHFAQSLCALYEEHAEPGWRWFEERITYGNAKMSEALLVAWDATGEERFKQVGLTSLAFLVDLCWNGEYCDFVGNQGWAERGRQPARFSQQPIDAGYLVEAFDTAFRVTGDAHYARMARMAFDWFLGRNRLGVPLYDPATGAVSDGLDPQGVSRNQGAESVICFLLALGRIRRLAREAPGAGLKRVTAQPEPNSEPATARRHRS